MARVICAKSRWTRRKLPLVIRWMAATASASVKSSADRVRPIDDQCRCSTKVSSSALRHRYSWTKPIRLYSCGVAGEDLLDAGQANQDHAEVAAVVVVAELLEGGWLEPVCFIDDEQFDEAGALLWASSAALEEVLRRWDRIENPRAYARKATISNLIKNKQRGQQRIRDRMIQRGDYQLERDLDPGLTVWEEQEWMMQLLESLPTAQREVLVSCASRPS